MVMTCDDDMTTTCALGNKAETSHCGETCKVENPEAWDLRPAHGFWIAGLHGALHCSYRPRSLKRMDNCRLPHQKPKTLNRHTAKKLRLS